jgi:hypothetical protein
MEQRSREDYIRDRAYQIWEKEGRPDGHHDRHWQQAAEEWSTAEAAYHKGGNASSDQGAGPNRDQSAENDRDAPALSSQVKTSTVPANTGSASEDTIKQRKSA